MKAPTFKVPVQPGNPKSAKVIKQGPIRKPKLDSPLKETGMPSFTDGVLEKLGAYYDDGPKDYLMKNNRGDFMRVRESDLKRHFKQQGVAGIPLRAQVLSEADALITKIQLERSISYAGPLAGYDKGPYEISGRIILVTDSPKLIEPADGDWPILRQLIENMLDSERHVQSLFLYGWLKFALESMYSRSRAPGQALVLAGERECGKSLLQDVFTELFGGRSAKPYQFMTGGTAFNADLFGAEHLKIEDEAASKDLRARREFGAALKQITANRDQRHHGKNRNAVTLNPFWRISISLNDEPENLLVLPPLEDGINDKLIMLKAVRRTMPMPAASGREKDEFRHAISRELPAFAGWLRDWNVPEAIAADRYGIASFHHPDLLVALDELAPEIQLLNLLDEFLRTGDTSDWRGTATALEESLSMAFPTQARSLLRNAATCGTYLERLSKKFPDRIFRKVLHGVREWVILARGLEAEE